MQLIRKSTLKTNESKIDFASSQRNQCIWTTKNVLQKQTNKSKNKQTKINLWKDNIRSGFFNLTQTGVSAPTAAVGDDFRSLCGPLNVQTLVWSLKSDIWNLKCDICSCMFFTRFGQFWHVMGKKVVTRFWGYFSNTCNWESRCRVTSQESSLVSKSPGQCVFI